MIACRFSLEPCQDPEAAIRTNAVICVGRVSGQLCEPRREISKGHPTENDSFSMAFQYAFLIFSSVS